CGVKAKAVDVVLLDPVEQGRDEEALHLGAREIEIKGAPGRVLAVGNGTLEKMAVVVVPGQTGGVRGEVNQNDIEDDTDPFAVERINEPLEVGRASQPRRGGIEPNHLVAPRANEGMLENPHQFDVRISHVFDVWD